MIGFLGVLEKHDKSINLLYLMPSISMFFIWVHDATTINFILTVMALGVSISLIAYVRALTLVVKASPKAKREHIQKFQEFDLSYYQNRRNFPLGGFLIIDVVLFFALYFATAYWTFVNIEEDMLLFGSLFFVQVSMLVYVLLTLFFVWNFFGFYKVKL